MTVDDLLIEQAELQRSLDSWRQKLADAQAAQATAQRQIDIHAGHLERINIWIARLQEKEHAKP